MRERRALVLSAPPGAGKTTRVPPALAVDGPVIVLQPRRMAARSIARHIAREQGWTIGEDVGWHVRFERRFSSRTQVLLATEGILTARLQQDPLLSAFTTIVLDEFHERSVHADLGLALGRQAWLARDDLRIVVMSATLDTSAPSRFLNGCPVIDVPGRLYPLQTEYRAEQDVASAAGDLMAKTRGGLLCFLPGAPEIRRAEPEVRAAVGPGVEVIALHGSLPPEEQDRALDETAGRRVILATNIAETSVTVPNVTCVIDTGLQKVARYDPGRGIDSLELERVSRDSADQRAGRAGRLGPGLVRRLWSSTDRLRPRREAEIHRVDLSEPVLDLIAWSADPRTFEWFDAPSSDRIDAAVALLEQLGAIVAGRLSAIGREMQRLPLHPRLSRMLIEARGGRDAARACALLAERHVIAPLGASTTSDLLSAVDNARRLPPHVIDVGNRLASLVAQREDTSAVESETRFLRAIFAAYPDRVARRRGPGSTRFLLATGHGAVLARESGVHDAEFIVAVDVQAGRRGEGSEALIRMASAIDPAWLKPTRSRVEHSLDEQGRARAVERLFYGEIPLLERPAPIDPDEASRLLAAAYLSRDLPAADRRLVRRLRFAGLDHDVAPLVARAAAGRTSLSHVTLQSAIDRATGRELDRLAPETIAVPSGRAVRLDYREDGSVVAAVKLQELFGLADTPRIGPRQQPVVFSMLAPNGRPVQTTTDLRSFWNTTYSTVRRELRGRYPKHPWPDDPWSAPPTAHARRRRRSD